MKDPAAGVAAAVLALAGLLCSEATAQSVVLAGRMGDRALLVVDGKAQTVAVGGSAGGVRLLRWVGEEAEIELAGQKAQLRVGGTPAQVGAGARAAVGREVVMTASTGGHFTPTGSINGKSVSFLVDTGATMVAMGQDDAQRLGVDLKSARAGMSQTANGPVRVWMVTLDRVRVGEVELTQVAAVVLPQPMPFVLLGNSFLSRFQMRRDNDVMRLELR